MMEIIEKGMAVTRVAKLKRDMHAFKVHQRSMISAKRSVEMD
jgi:hypothetical protein